MKLVEIQEIARQYNISPARIKKVALVRIIQKHEKHDPCFKTGRVRTCEEVTCRWRDDCR